MIKPLSLSGLLRRTGIRATKTTDPVSNWSRPTPHLDRVRFGPNGPIRKFQFFFRFYRSRAGGPEDSGGPILDPIRPIGPPIDSSVLVSPRPQQSSSSFASIPETEVRILTGGERSDPVAVEDPIGN
ncbi:hypothetical protein NL676_010328 [Syzygium grande]|nr:hypothetical protein NL676_010328 [Syzygium grande]